MCQPERRCSWAASQGPWSSHVLVVKEAILPLAFARGHHSVASHAQTAENHGARTSPGEDDREKTCLHRQRRRGGRNATRPPGDRCQPEDADLRAAGQPDQPRSGVDHRDRHPQLLADGLRDALRPRPVIQSAAADGRRPHYRRRRPALDDEAARRAGVPRRHAGAGARLRRLAAALAEARRGQRDIQRARRCDRGARRPHAGLAFEEAIPAAGAFPVEGAATAGDRAGATGRHRSVQAAYRHRRLRAVPFPAGRIRLRQPRRLCAVRQVRAAPGAGILHRGRPQGAAGPRRVAHHPRRGHQCERDFGRRGGLAGTAVARSHPDAEARIRALRPDCSTSTARWRSCGRTA